MSEQQPDEQQHEERASDPRLQPLDGDSSMPGEFVDVPENQPGDHDRPGADDDHNGAEIPDAPITAARTGVGTPN